VHLHDLLGGVVVLEHSGTSRVEITSITHDSREVVPGACFCCIPGATADGHRFAAEAVARGAVALIVEHLLDLPVTQARVAHVRDALGRLADNFYGHPSGALRVLGVTGTNGKTTTTYLVESIARAAGERVGVIGTIGARIDGVPVPGERTTPEATELLALFARMRDAGVGTVAMEVSSHALHQRRTDATRFAAACFTNLSHDHLDYHGSLDAYFEAKAQLFRADVTATAAVNVDDERGEELASRCRAEGIPVRTYGLGAGADVRPEAVQLEADGTRLTLLDAPTGDRADLHTNLVGPFNVANTLAAAATSLQGGLPFPAVVRGLGADVVVPGRMQRIDAGQPFTVLVDYAHTPDALASVLAAATMIRAPDAQVTVVFGCGGDRDREKRPLMGAIAAREAETVVVTSDNSRSEPAREIAAAIVAGARTTGRSPLVELDRRAAIALALRAARPGDVVVIAGKGHETGQTTDDVTVPFDDAEECVAALAARGWSSS
jgi:UDP-N-acetylmuramoyl-L-alanyl-D-glutamate--2,6-diaminopimelate ligase